MAASYPTSVKSFTAVNDGDTVSDEMFEEAYDEITAMQQALLTTGLAHHLFPDATSRTLGTSSKPWGTTYIDGHVLVGTTDSTNMLDDDIRTAGRLWIGDNLAVPSARAGFACIFVDTNDGDLKVRFGDGTVKTIVVDT